MPLQTIIQIDTPAIISFYIAAGKILIDWIYGIKTVFFGGVCLLKSCYINNMNFFILVVFSPDGNGKPGAEKACFSCLKKATEGSSFQDIEKRLL